MPAEPPAPAARYESYSHETMAAEVAQDNDPVVAGEVGLRWEELSRRLQDSTEELAQLIAGTHEKWQGEAGDAARVVMGKATHWLAHSASVSSTLGQSIGGQAEVAARARADMPPPVAYDPVGMIRDAAGSGNILTLAALADAMEARRAEAEAARQKAIDVMNTRDAALHGLTPRTGFSAPSLGGPA